MKQLVVISLLGVLCLCGCEGLRYAATEAQRENAWVHRQVCAAAAETAVDERASSELCGLTDLANAHEEKQDRSMPFIFLIGIVLGIGLTWILLKT